MPRRKTERKFRKGTNWTTGRPRDEIIQIDDGDSCTYGVACSRLRKAWMKLRIAKSNEDGISFDEAKDTINKLKRALGVPETDFEGYEQGVTDSWNQDD